MGAEPLCFYPMTMVGILTWVHPDYCRLAHTPSTWHALARYCLLQHMACPGALLPAPAHGLLLERYCLLQHMACTRIHDVHCCLAPWPDPGRAGLQCLPRGAYSLNVPDTRWCTRTQSATYGSTSYMNNMIYGSITHRLLEPGAGGAGCMMIALTLTHPLNLHQLFGNKQTREHLKQIVPALRFRYSHAHWLTDFATATPTALLILLPQHGRTGDANCRQQ